MNICSGCDKNFRRLTTFDMHRVGKFDKPNHKFDGTSGRRCLSTEEMLSRGFHINNKGSWSYGTFKMGIFKKGGAA